MNKTYNTILQIIKTTGRHINNPYHNAEHCLYVYNKGTELLSLYGVDPSPEFMWATLFHDYDHSGGTEPDDVNIDRAIAGFEHHFAEYQSSHPGYKLNTDTVKSLIRCTMFTGVFPNDPTSLEEMCIRDADLMSCAADIHTAIIFMDGLFIELSHKFPDMSREEFVEKNEIFLKTAHMYTDPGKQFLKYDLADKLEILNSLLLSIDERIS